jgi:hypothetical protein
MALSDTLSEFVAEVERYERQWEQTYGGLGPHLAQMKHLARAMGRYLDAPPYPEEECPVCGQPGIPVRWPGCLEAVHPWGSCVSRR